MLGGNNKSICVQSLLFSSCSFKVHGETLFPRVTDEAPEAEGWLTQVMWPVSHRAEFDPGWLLSLHSGDDHIGDLGSILSQGYFWGSYWATHLKTLDLGLLTCKLVILLISIIFRSFVRNKTAAWKLLSKFIKHYKNYNHLLLLLKSCAMCANQWSVHKMHVIEIYLLLTWPITLHKINKSANKQMDKTGSLLLP